MLRARNDGIDGMASSVSRSFIATEFHDPGGGRAIQDQWACFGAGIA
jgi:hypothetical protein